MQLCTRKTRSQQHLPADLDIIKTGRATSKARLKFLNKMPTTEPPIKTRNEAYKRQQQLFAQEDKNLPNIKFLDYKEYMDPIIYVLLVINLLDLVLLVLEIFYLEKSLDHLH